MATISLRLFMAGFAATLVGCVTTQSDNPARRAELEARFENRPDTYPDRGAFKAPPAWAVGQYVVMGNTEKGRRESITRMAIVGKEEGGYVIEMIQEDTNGKTGQQVLIKGLDKIAAGEASPDTMEIVWMRVMDDKGQIQKIEGQMMGLMAMPMRTTFRKMFGVQSEERSSPGGSIQVPAGTFAGTTRSESEVRTMGMTFRSTVYTHPAVPINGAVRSESGDGKSRSELLAFGMNGAQASF